MTGKIKLPHASGNSMSIAAPATNPASDLTLTLPATIGTAGQVLKNSSTPGTLEFGAAGGITVADQWRRTSGLTTNNGENFITSDWESVDSSGLGTLGTNMSESGGIFSFPSTGIYFVSYQAYCETSSDSTVNSISIYITDDNSSYSSRASSLMSIESDPSGYAYANGHCEAMVDVTNISNVKVKFRVYSNGYVDWNSSTAENRLHTTFIRMGDT
jgi:hypothetical protein